MLVSAKRLDLVQIGVAVEHYLSETMIAVCGEEARNPMSETFDNAGAADGVEFIQGGLEPVAPSSAHLPGPSTVRRGSVLRDPDGSYWRRSEETYYLGARRRAVIEPTWVLLTALSPADYARQKRRGRFMMFILMAEMVVAAAVVKFGPSLSEPQSHLSVLMFVAICSVMLTVLLWWAWLKSFSTMIERKDDADEAVS